jgi:hypothetical protein
MTEQMEGTVSVGKWERNRDQQPGLELQFPLLPPPSPPHLSYLDRRTPSFPRLHFLRPPFPSRPQPRDPDRATLTINVATNSVHQHQYQQTDLHPDRLYYRPLEDSKMTTMLTLAPAVTVPYTESRPTSSSSRVVRPLPRKQNSFVTTAASSPSSASPGARSASGSYNPQTQGHIKSSSRSVSSSAAPIASSSKVRNTPPAEPELRPSPSPAVATSTANTAATAAAQTPANANDATPATNAPGSAVPPIDIHTFNPQELLRLLATLLGQIASTNDNLPAQPTSPPSSSDANAPKPPIWNTLTMASRISLGTSTTSLSFHARNIPTISLEAYLLRILKYCPTTNEVFLALLVYFDRMSKLVGEATGRTFVIDSYNIHRLVIAGVTVASKFFSDVFYTNSRYAKVSIIAIC